ncbi:hypothetical protein [[Eubacterium] hominis]|uniref:hypothetical protein n=1 Tax=[Eubacterium] hominis TaxID=2764325 RepID=UPI003A4D8D41
MSAISIVIIGFILLVVFSMDLFRKSKLKMINAALEAKNYDAVIAMTESKFNRMLITNYVGDLYYLRAMYFKSPDETFIPHLFDVFRTQSEEENRKDILETYYHIFLNNRDKECATQILEKIKTMQNRNFVRVSQFAYDVVFDQEGELISDMEALVESLRGFDVGVAAYYIGMYYELHGNLEMAQAYYNSCEGCFNSNHFYAKQAKDHVLSLEKELS